MEVLAILILVIVGMILLYKYFKNRSPQIAQNIPFQDENILENSEKIGKLHGIISELEKSNKLKDRQLSDMQAKSTLNNKRSLQLGQNIIKGELVEILCSYAILTEYDSLSLVSSVSRQSSFDIIGVKKDQIDFIEVKNNHSPLSYNEINIKKIIESKNVFYKVIEGNFPSMEIKERHYLPNDTYHYRTTKNEKPMDTFLKSQ
jgi:hypothetical protein